MPPRLNPRHLMNCTRSLSSLIAFVAVLSSALGAFPRATAESLDVDPRIAFANAKHETIKQRIAHKRRLSEVRFAVGLAKVAHKKYVEVDAVQQRSALEDAIVLAKKRNEQADERRRWSERLANKGLISQASLELDEAAAKRTAVELSNARDRLATFNKNGHTSRMRKLAAAVKAAQAKHDLIQTTMAGELSELHAKERAAEATFGKAVRQTNSGPGLDVLQAAVKRAESDLTGLAKFHNDELKRAEDAVDAARQRLAEFDRGEHAQGLDEQRNEIRTLTESLEAAQQQVAWSERVLRKGYVTLAELEQDRLATMEKTIAVKAAKLKLKLAEEKLLPLELAELKASVTLAEQEKRRVEALRKATIERATYVAQIQRQAYQSALARSRKDSGDTTGAGGR